MNAYLEVIKFNAEDVLTTSGACANPGQIIDECDPEAE